MRFSSYFIFYAKLQTLSSERQQALLRCLSNEHIENIRKYHAKNIEFSPKDFFASAIVAKMHYSWFLPFLQQQENPAFFFPFFSEKIGKKIAKSLLIPWEIPQLSPVFSDYLRLVLQEAVTSDHDFLPVAYLQESPLSKLLYLDKNTLLWLIDSLGLYDIAIELRQIVDKKILQEISNMLSAEEKKRIANISAQSLKPIFPRTHYKNIESFEEEMHKKGLMRLAIALLQEPSHLAEEITWHITKVLDKGRGMRILSIQEKKALAHHAQDMLKCVVDIIQEFSL